MCGRRPNRLDPVDIRIVRHSLPGFVSAGEEGPPDVVAHLLIILIASDSISALCQGTHMPRAALRRRRSVGRQVPHASRKRAP